MHSHDNDDDEITELPAGEDPAVPPKKKKKKKKSKDKAKEEASHPEVPDDGARPGSSSGKARGNNAEPMPATDPSGVPDEETEQPKEKEEKEERAKRILASRNSDS